MNTPCVANNYQEPVAATAGIVSSSGGPDNLLPRSGN